MKYFTRDVVVDGVNRKQFYIPVGMEDFETGNQVIVRQWAGEFSESELIAAREVAEKMGTIDQQEIDNRKHQADIQIKEIDDKLACFRV